MVRKDVQGMVTYNIKDCKCPKCGAKGELTLSNHDFTCKACGKTFKELKR